MKQKIWQRDLPEIFYLYADSRYSGSNLSNNNWILSRSGMNPPALTVQSDPKNTNGQINIFSGFREGKVLIYDPNDYFESAQINTFYFNWIEYSFQPIKDILITSTLWVPDPNTICGIFKIRNQSNHKRKIHLDLGCLSSLFTTGKRMGSLNYHGLDILSGQMESWHPVLFLSGNTQFRAGPYPTLSSEVELRPGSQEVLHWVAVLGPSLDESISDLEKINKINWEGEISRMRIAAQDQIEIETEDLEWNYAIKMSQKEAAAFFARNIKYSGGIQDNFQIFSAFQALYLLQVLSPLDPDMARKILDEVIKAEKKKSDPTDHEKNQHTDLLSLPLLGELIWQISQNDPKINDLKIGLDTVVNILVSWFSKYYDQDGDGIPELIHPYQLNLADPRPEQSLSIFEFYDNMPFQESPGLGVILFNELDRLLELITSFGPYQLNTTLDGKQDLLRNFINLSWNRKRSCFYNRDRDTHHQLQGEKLIEDSREKFVVLRKDLSIPSRIGVSIQEKTLPEISPKLQLTIHGSNREGNYRIENITKPQIHWLSDSGWVISQTIFSSIDYITVKGAGKESSLTVIQPGTYQENISLLLPLWAKLLKPQDAASMINNTIVDPDKFWSPYGIRSYPDPEVAVVQLPWNLLLGQGLLFYGYKRLAVELFKGWMDACIKNLDRSGCFFPTINAKSGEGTGESNSLEGLIPIGFLLQLIGVKIIPNQKIIIEGEYPFSWSVTLKYRGIMIQRDQQSTKVNVPGEKTILIKGSEKNIIPLS